MVERPHDYLTYQKIQPSIKMTKHVYKWLYLHRTKNKAKGILTNYDLFCDLQIAARTTVSRTKIERLEEKKFKYGGGHRIIE